MESTQLRPCTKCGSEHIQICEFALKSGGKLNYYIRCNHCGYQTNNLYDEDELILIWNTASRESDPLHPCPFCSSSNLTLKSASLSPQGATWEVLWYVKCIDCKGHGGYRKEKLGAALAWNTRGNKLEKTLHENL